MIWKASSEKIEFEKYKNYWRPYFCLIPRHVEGYWIWLETVEAERNYWGDWVFTWGSVKEFRLTERLKAKIGLKW